MSGVLVNQKEVFPVAVFRPTADKLVVHLVNDSELGENVPAQLAVFLDADIARMTNCRFQTTFRISWGDTLNDSDFEGWTFLWSLPFGSCRILTRVAISARATPFQQTFWVYRAPHSSII